MLSVRRAFVLLVSLLILVSGCLGDGNQTATPPPTHTTPPPTHTTPPPMHTTPPPTHTTPPPTHTTPPTTHTTPPTTHTTPATTHTSPTVTVLPTNSTMQPSNSTTVPTNGTTTNATTAGPTAPPTPAPDVNSFRVNNTKGQTCMLLDFNAVVSVKYNKYDNVTAGSVVPDVVAVNITDSLSYEGYCDNTKVRNFTLYYPDANNPCVQLVLTFAARSDQKTYSNRQSVLVNYTEPCFPDATVNYTQTEQVDFAITYNGTIGKSFQCTARQCLSKTGRFVVDMTHILFQPFAQNSSDKGNFGDVESCEAPVTVPTTAAPPPTKPSPSHGGRIAGIVIAVLIAVVVVVALGVWIIRRRRYKAVHYGNLTNE